MLPAERGRPHHQLTVSLLTDPWCVAACMPVPYVRKVLRQQLHVSSCARLSPGEVV